MRRGVAIATEKNPIDVGFFICVRIPNRSFESRRVPKSPQFSIKMVLKSRDAPHSQTAFTDRIPTALPRIVSATIYLH